VDFQQGIVGDGSKIINQLAERANRIPWNIFVLAINEAEALSKREKKNERMLCEILRLIFLSESRILQIKEYECL
jgi:hypothetical protein